VVEETGWRPGPLHHLLDVRPSPGLTDGVHHTFLAEGATLIGEPTDVEAERIEWLSLTSVPGLIARGEIASASTVAALLYLLATGRDDRGPVADPQDR
jgi:hypothetical protein